MLIVILDFHSPVPRITKSTGDLCQQRPPIWTCIRHVRRRNRFGSHLRGYWRYVSHNNNLHWQSWRSTLAQVLCYLPIYTISFHFRSSDCIQPIEIKLIIIWSDRSPQPDRGMVPKRQNGRVAGGTPHASRLLLPPTVAELVEGWSSCHLLMPTWAWCDATSAASLAKHHT